MNDGGPAFPATTTGTLNDQGRWIPDSTNGMSLRDWFAGQALAGMLVEGFQPNQAEYQGNRVGFNYAEASYKMADAMLEARKEK